MNTAVLINFAESFIIGAVAVSAVSITADKFGSKLAGALAGFPATIAASLFYQAQPPAGTVQRVVEATTAIPLMMGLFGLLLAAYCALVRQGLLKALLLSLLPWMLFTTAVIFLGSPSFLLSVTIFVVCTITSYYLTEFRLNIPSQVGKKVTLSFQQTIVRCFVGGTLVGGSYLTGQFAGPVLGGIVAAFPAVTVSALVVTYQFGGFELSAALAKSLMLSGMINVTAYSIAVRYFYPAFGVFQGTLMSFLIACITGYTTWRFLKVNTT